MEAYITLLSILLTRIVFNHMTMFFVFLFIGFFYLPSEWVADMEAKTPAFFPEWFSLATYGSLVFALVCTMFWILISTAVKTVFKHLCETRRYKATMRETAAETDKLIKALNQLSEQEQDILARVFLGQAIKYPTLKDKLAIERLFELKLLSYSHLPNCYHVNSLIHTELRLRLSRWAEAH